MILRRSGGKFAVANRDDLRAHVIGDDVQYVVQAHDAEILQELDDGGGAALELGGNFFVLQVVDQPVFLDQGQQWV